MTIQREIEKLGIPTILIAALPPIAEQGRTPRAVAPRVPIGANAGAPNNVNMQYNILKDTLTNLVKIDSSGQIVDLPYEYIAKV